jgi:hypothetical protein
MQDSSLISHAQASQILRRAGISEQQIEEVLRDLPDPIDVGRYREALLERGITLDQLTDRMGGSP